MLSNKLTRFLFTGYAPVHFVCFRPLYQQLIARGCDVFVSGGLRSKTAAGTRYDERALYDPFEIPSERILAVEDSCQESFDVLFAANTRMITPKSVETRIQVFHGISFRNRYVRPENANCDAYFLVGPYMRRKFIETGLLEESDSRGVPIGFMKTDRLLNGELDRVELLNRYGFEGSKPIVLYAPTGAQHNSLETMGEEVVERLSHSGKYDVLIKLHDHPKNASTDWHARLVPLENAHTRVVREWDVIPQLFLADLLITDASSVANEYVLLDRPIVFLDVPKLIKKAMRKSGANVDLDTWGRRGGLLVTRPHQIVDVVDESLANPNQLSEVRRAMAADLFYNPGKAAEAAADWVEKEFGPAPRSLVAASPNSP